MINQSLAEEVRKHLGDSTTFPGDMAAFIESVSMQFDRYERQLTELSSKADSRSRELVELNNKLKTETTELKHAHSELSKIFNRVNEGFFTKDLITDQYTHMSIGCEKIYGYTADVFYSNTSLWYEVIYPDDRVVIEQEHELLINNLPVTSCYRIFHKDGSIRWLEVKAIPVFIDGTLARVDGVVNDVTARKNAEQLLKESEAKYRSFFENSMDGILLTKPNGSILEANPAACRIFKATEKQICEYSYDELLEFAESDKLRKMLEEHNRTGNSKGELTLLRRDKTSFVAEVDTSLFKDAFGEDRTCIIVRDISERKANEQALLMNEQQLDLIYNTVNDCIFMISVQPGNRFQFVSINHSFEESTGIPKSAIIGKYIEEVIPPHSLNLVLEKYDACVLHKTSVSWEETTLYPTGIKTGIVTINPALDDNGECIRIIGSVYDITEKKKAEEAVKKTEQNFQSLINTIDGIVWEADADTLQFSFVSKRAEILLGHPVNDWIDDTGFWRDHIHPDDREHAVEYYKKSTRERKSHEFEYRMIAADGNIVWLQDFVSVIFNKDQTYYLRGVMVDITERKKTEQRIADSERRYRTLFEQNLAGIYQTTLGGELITCNNAFSAMLGYDSVDELKRVNVADLYQNRADRDTFITHLKTQKKLLNYEITLNNKAGAPLNMIENVSLFTDPVSGKEICEGIMFDITERKKAESMLQVSEQRYRQIVETAQEGIWMMDKYYRTVFANKKMCEIFEYSLEEMMGWANLDFMEESKKGSAKIIIEQLNSRQSKNFDFDFITKNGKYLWASLSASPIWDAHGQFAGVLAMVTDITKRKNNEELLRKSEANLDLKNKELERKNKELEQFAYVASHDLQEPLRTTSSFVNLLKQQYEGKLDDKADKYLSFIHDSSERMKVLIKDLLDYSRIGNKHEMNRVNCNQLLGDVIADLHTAISDAGAEIISTELPVIKGYPTELKQLLQNLLINAIKFARKDVPPRVRISVQKKNGFWDFTLEDNGIGIKKEYWERIFIIFQRLHTRSEYQGSGIGLSHCKKIVELHHGKIWVISEPGKGSTFHFTIPESHGIQLL